VRHRRTDQLHEDFLRYAAETGHPLPPGSSPPPTPTFPIDLNEWHQQEFGVPFITPEDEVEDFDDPYYTSDPPPHYSGQGPTPGDPRPSGSGHYPPPPYPGPGPIPGDPRPFGSVTITILLLHLLLIIIRLLHLVFLRVMSLLGTPHSRKT
jgi:hypothetical protein